MSDKIRPQICAAANSRCGYGKTSSKLTEMLLVMDHILPQVAGGRDESENLAAACPLVIRRFNHQFISKSATLCLN